MNNFEAINLIALQGVIKPDAQSNLRYVLRWYSKTFHTPLHQVANEVPIEDVWLAYFEERYREMSQEDLEEQVQRALETPEAKKARLAAEEAEAASEAAFRAMTEKAAQKPPENHTTFKAAAGLLDQIPQLPQPAEQANLAPPDVPAIEPDITMEFIDPGDMEKLLNEGNANETKPVDPMSFR